MRPRTHTVSQKSNKCPQSPPLPLKEERKTEKEEKEREKKREKEKKKERKKKERKKSEKNCWVMDGQIDRGMEE